jgi:hypothetical protein
MTANALCALLTMVPPRRLRSSIRSPPPHQIHAFEPLWLSKRQLFVTPANGNFDGIVYFLLINVSTVGECRGSDAFSNAVTGCVGTHSLLSARLHFLVRSQLFSDDH